jgi:hypothetical protein
MRMLWLRSRKSSSTNPYAELGTQLPRLPNMTVDEFLERVASISYSYKTACLQLKKIDDQSEAQITDAEHRRDAAANRLRTVAREFANG